MNTRLVDSVNVNRFLRRPHARLCKPCTRVIQRLGASAIEVLKSPSAPLLYHTQADSPTVYHSGRTYCPRRVLESYSGKHYCRHFFRVTCSLGEKTDAASQPDNSPMLLRRSHISVSLKHNLLPYLSPHSFNSHNTGYSQNGARHHP